MPPSSEQYAQLAALFTTSAESSVTSSIELLLPAHLPVQGGLWLVPYAGREAGQGLSMLVRMHEETIDVAAIGKGHFDFSECNTIEDVIERIDVPISNWIVQPPSNADPISLLHCDADRVTLLSGADQAAVVGAYRLLKGLIAAMGENESLPPLRLVIVGTEERAASDAASRIVQTAHHQLDVQIEVGQPLPAMRSTNNVVSQVSFPRLRNVVDLMATLRLEVTPRDEVETSPSEAPPEDALPITPRFEPKEPQPRITHEQVEKQVKVVLAGKPQDQEQKNDFASYVDGLLSISPRCPEHDHVELAVDSDGKLHILAHADDLRDAAIVSAWSMKHHALLSMACGGIELEASVQPVQHLFTADAVAVADLQGSGLRLHLLTDVEVQGNVGAFSTPLN
jgi:hypothetical protein